MKQRKGICSLSDFVIGKQGDIPESYLSHKRKIIYLQQIIQKISFQNIKIKQKTLVNNKKYLQATLKKEVQLI